MTLFGITSIITFFASVGFGLVVYSSNRESKLNKSWLILSIFIAFWSIFLYGVVSSQSENSALLWQYCLDFIAIFIPVLYLNFILEFLNIKNNALKFGSFLFTMFLAVFSFSSYFKIGVIKSFDFYWVNPGKYYFIFPAFFIAIIIISLIYLIKAYLKNKNDYTLRGQIRNQLIAGIIGFSGGITNFFPQLFDIYPFGNYFIILYVFFVSYAVLKYKFLDTKVISTQLFSGAITLVFLFNLLKHIESISEWLINFVIFIMIVTFVTLLNRSMYKELEAKRQIEELAENLKDANVQLKKMDKQKSEFINLASHQLRGPVASLKGYSSMILEGSYGPISKKIEDVVTRLSQSSNALALIIDDFLNLSRIERGKIEFNFTEGNLKEVVDSAVEELKQKALDKKLKMTFTAKKGNYTLNMDSEKVRQIVSNLIDNSIKYTPKGSIKVKLSQENEEMLLEVTDTGIGVPPQDMDKLFKKFSRLANANEENIQGTGLGLYLAKEVMNAHNGKIWIESEGQDKGSSFFVEFKAKERRKTPRINSEKELSEAK
ncbi:TPA: hypothetical protein DCZ46_03050 [Candidatus Campbellbacteria bacterium]|nr:MAG: PAS/PAC sensor signal transduction histidine kinase [Candidatus Campbellbacteria bacterium GW2011_OD1_34_28]KKP74894.1 MAG: HATPase domain-containing multisensor signal transduction histidine kinase [Candidatus Campbellbacteria bacterium GW2011_GWD2_35_24]KKP75780.1 MAG: PAS/PAC sensor signal transduction histidine kinase [Candidatus Campbellbacteria bacterium GW2011_GWC2_35_28]KKP76972.1 MAG: PAS/PAC sensor signal transduction histidine kinase [Candidatus Campbellbacteria bacterium GW20